MVWQAQDRRQAPAAERLEESLRQAIRQQAVRYPTPRAGLLTALHLVQERLGHVSEAAQEQVAELLELAPALVKDTVTFYEMFSTTPRGRHVIGVCESLSCELCGCAAVRTQLEAVLGVAAGQTTADGKFTLRTVQCLGACDFAPAVLIDDRLYTTVAVEAVAGILREFD